MRALFVVALTAFAAHAADPKPDVTVTAETMSKEFQGDKKAFEAKYKGKLVEMTGKVYQTRPELGDVLLVGVKNAPLDCPLPEKDQEKLRGLALGQQVTITGKCNGSVPSLSECSFTKIGPSTALTPSVAGLAADIKGNRAAAEKKYGGKSVIMRAKVTAAEFDNDRLVLTITDAAGKVSYKAQTYSIFEQKYIKELKAVKAGDTIVLIGVPVVTGDPNDEPALSQIVILKEPPAGVKLPMEKK